MYLARSANECLYQVVEDKVFKLLRVNDEKVLIEVSSPEHDLLQIRFVNTAPSDAARLAVLQYVREWFDLDTNLKPFYELAARDECLKPLVRKYAGLRVVGIPDLFEALCWAIIGQQINLTFAYTLKRRFVESYGDSILWCGEKYWLFPSPETIAELSSEDLKPLQFSGKKAEYAIEVAKQMSSGQLSKSRLQGIGPKDAERELVSIRGIGAWTANYVLMRCLHDASAFPIQDVGLHNAIKQLLGLEKKPSLPEIQQLASNWKGYEAYATFYLWRSLYDGV